MGTVDQVPGLPHWNQGWDFFSRKKKHGQIDEFSIHMIYHTCHTTIQIHTRRPKQFIQHNLRQFEIMLYNNDNIGPGFISPKKPNV